MPSMGHRGVLVIPLLLFALSLSFSHALFLAPSNTLRRNMLEREDSSFAQSFAEGWMYVRTCVLSVMPWPHRTTNLLNATQRIQMRLLIKYISCRWLVHVTERCVKESIFLFIHSIVCVRNRTTHAQTHHTSTFGSGFRCRLLLQRPFEWNENRNSVWIAFKRFLFSVRKLTRRGSHTTHTLNDRTHCYRWCDNIDTASFSLIQLVGHFSIAAQPKQQQYSVVYNCSASLSGSSVNG